MLLVGNLYFIENNSLVPIHVEGIKAEFDSDNFSGYSFVSSKDSVAASKVYLKMKQSSANSDVSKGNSVTFETDYDATALESKWNIGPKDGVGKKMYLTFEGKMDQRDIQSTWANTPAKMLTITYTIAAGTAGTTNSDNTLTAN